MDVLLTRQSIRLLLLALLFIAASSLRPAGCSAQEYTIASLGSLGGNWVSVQAVNRLGQVSGYAYNADGQLHAFRWRDATLTDLGTLGGSWSVARCINNAGTIGGYAQTPF